MLNTGFGRSARSRKPQRPGHGLHRGNDVGDVFVERQTEQLRAFLDVFAPMSAGAYGFVMASNYNTHAMAAEVLISGHKSAVVCERQKLPQIWKSEKLPRWLK